ncbi:TIR domain-containing protein [Nitrosomonas aestuarii]|uniref:TIR domain-containing protein n=1 Tax=Nitrosomonas aestuarii TaxID=52441 RepID=UPI000D2FE5B7|nr:nucleotide-binding protein [Nitrosomonas aestuarii]PTN11558.1 putative nucleotide-binding protein with TIR-like domain [Nitrosomonas aestuarii]
MFREQANTSDSDIVINQFTVEHDDSVWKYDSIDEFLADYRKFNGFALFSIYSGSDYELTVHAYSRYVNISVAAPTRIAIERVFEEFEKSAEKCQLISLPEAGTSKYEPFIFIGHGRSSQWRDLKDHLQDKHDIKINAYETGARAGHSIRDILEDMANKSSFALLVFTGEDEQGDGKLRARQNVVHEAGILQGRLGFSRAIMLVEEGLDDFSNVYGIQQIRFSKGNIKETYGEVLATTRREFT